MKKSVNAYSAGQTRNSISNFENPWTKLSNMKSPTYQNRTLSAVSDFRTRMGND